MPLDSIVEDAPEIFSFGPRGDTAKAKALGIKSYYSEESLDTLSFLESYGHRGTIYLNYFYRTKIEDPITALANLDHTNTFEHRWLYSRAITWQKIKTDPNAFIDYITRKIPFYLFFFTPFYALFFWVLYSRRKYTYVEHVIFIFHIFSFVFLALDLFIIPDLILDRSFFISLLFLFLGPIYFFIALHNFYRQSWGITFLKFMFLNMEFVVGFFIATLLFVAASAAIY